MQTLLDQASAERGLAVCSLLLSAHLSGVFVRLAGHSRSHLHLSEGGHAVVLVAVQIPHRVEREVVAHEHVAEQHRRVRMDTKRVRQMAS